MERILRSLYWKTTLVYFDDHLKNLSEVMQLMSSAGLKLSVKKCEMFQKEVKYLGHRVMAAGIYTHEDKIRAGKDWPTSQNWHELHSFQRLCTYYRHFVANFAGVTTSLHKLAKKSRAYRWTEVQEKAFQALKKLLCTAPVVGEKFVLIQALFCTELEECFHKWSMA
ncbi:Retrovirus-related Pol polyprotein from transposon 17.6 [Eumeta japonica]|uniref:RNA-directed DNA polymerase n=1 Tax=Eumeta variegata TaxID=151549 RepID=A0A4C1SP01_EUMVA|nr:Retrovirus-related Pol polyprotein from transposon 17.6 [Eumeta japonica]